jgi:hypothetical protein
MIFSALDQDTLNHNGKLIFKFIQLTHKPHEVLVDGLLNKIQNCIQFLSRPKDIHFQHVFIVYIKKLLAFCCCFSLFVCFAWLNGNYTQDKLLPIISCPNLTTLQELIISLILNK